jgi:hypothetical protein
MVVMEYLSGWVMLGEKPHQEQLNTKEKLKNALRIIHDQDLVHGDVWCPNVLVFEDDINFVDFDDCGLWKGRSEEVSAQMGPLVIDIRDLIREWAVCLLDVRSISTGVGYRTGRRLVKHLQSQSLSVS